MASPDCGAPPLSRENVRQEEVAVDGEVHHPDEAHPGWYVPHVPGDRMRFLGPDGMPTLRLIPYTDWYGEQVLRLCDDATGLLVAPKDGRLGRLPAG